MYNRYIPQPDGSYRRNRCPEPVPHPKPQPPKPVPKPEPPCPEPDPQPCCPPPREEPKPCPKHPPHPKSGGSVTDFLRQLLPKNFDTADLLIVLLLLLMAGDCREDQNTALLTLVLYLFL
jgi:hypothetical protein